ncbi:glycosyltransferase family A protein [Ferrimonas balearica]|uniref:glycosyltransferase family A protein n=1 Tax=Ferrimonas balearica TaxID=44012 RepID=UPI001C57402F|nr:glycosyltransferase family A protein [Ferrimonas balearica]MBW3141221.1 glycosyltransferase family 2 protein [Ferrimonas balearica]MBW3166080.1 glycosyltransferase family 2 protein [Ferrimonas balearica]
MTERHASEFTLGEKIVEASLRLAASGGIPGRWFNKALPEQSALTPAEAPLTLEIVSHCWKYSEFQLYQLSSLVNYPPTALQVVHTVFYSEEDDDTVRLLDFFRTMSVENVRWNFQPMPKEELFRRAIGRNRAAKATEADWVWFTDCDVVFHEGALDALAKQLEGRQDYLVYPQQMLATELLSKDDPLILEAKRHPRLMELDLTRFSVRKFSRATGPIQIAHGDVARACGYCPDLKVYQKPMPRWSKCYEDRAFRWLLGTQGTPIEVPNVLFIRHAEKGRYQQGSQLSLLRKTIRRIKSALIGR